MLWQVILFFMCHSTLFAVRNDVHTCLYSLHSLQLPREHSKSPGIIESPVAVLSDENLRVPPGESVKAWTGIIVGEKTGFRKKSGGIAWFILRARTGKGPIFCVKSRTCLNNCVMSEFQYMTWNEKLRLCFVKSRSSHMFVEHPVLWVEDIWWLGRIISDRHQKSEVSLPQYLSIFIKELADTNNNKLWNQWNAALFCNQPNSLCFF